MPLVMANEEGKAQTESGTPSGSPKCGLSMGVRGERDG